MKKKKHLLKSSAAFYYSVVLQLSVYRIAADSFRMEFFYRRDFKSVLSCSIFRVAYFEVQGRHFFRNLLL